MAHQQGFQDGELQALDCFGVYGTASTSTVIWGGVEGLEINRVQQLHASATLDQPAVLKARRQALGLMWWWGHL